MVKNILVAGALALGLSGCAAGGILATAGGPVESIVSREVGYPSYFERGLDIGAEGLGCELPRDPVTGDC